MKQFEIYMADLSPIVIGSGQGGVRPVVIIQNMITDDMDRIICAAITTKDVSDEMSIEVKTEDGKSVRILLEQIRSVDRNRLKEKVTYIAEDEFRRIKGKLTEVLALE